MSEICLPVANNQQIHVINPPATALKTDPESSTCRGWRHWSGPLQMPPLPPVLKLAAESYIIGLGTSAGITTVATVAWPPLINWQMQKAKDAEERAWRERGREP